MIILVILIWLACGFSAVFKYKDRNGLTHAEVAWKTVEDARGAQAVQRTITVIVCEIILVAMGPWTYFIVWSEKHFPRKSDK